MRLDYGPLREGKGELGPVTEMLSWSFSFPIADAEPWLNTAGLENVRALRESDRPIACLILLPMGQYFGGKRVPMVGIAGVATAAHKRGVGAATELMRSAVRELHASGVPISTLYPATRPLYRRAGYEPAGSRLELSIPASTIKVKERGMPIRPAEEADREAIYKLYEEVASTRPGYLDRSSYIWRRVQSPRGESAARGFVIEHGGQLDGYIYLYLKRATIHLHDVVVTCAIARSPAATRRLLGFLSDHAINAQNVRFRTGPSDPLALALPEVGFEISGEDQWMLRVIDVKRALEGRGYFEGLSSELHLEVRDDLIPDNSGRFVLTVEGGRGRVRKGGRGKLSLHIRGLAPLYTGHSTPAALASIGLIEGSPAELQKAAAIFAGPSPWMPDYF